MDKHTRRPLVSVIGDAHAPEDSAPYRMARETGRLLVEAGFRVASGGLAGVMTAVFIGAHEANGYKEGDTVAILPFLDRNQANQYADIVLATGMGHARNLIVANTDAIVVAGGGSGTLAEVALAWPCNRLIIALTDTGGTAARVAGTAIDQRPRAGNGMETVLAAQSPAAAVMLIQQHLPPHPATPMLFRGT